MNEEKFLHRHGKNMRRVVTNKFKRFRIFPGDNSYLCVLLDGPEQIPQRAVYLDHEGGLGKARSDPGHDFCARDPFRVRYRLAVGQGDNHLAGGIRHEDKNLSAGA